MLPHAASASPSPHLVCLPSRCRDPFGRPIVVVQLAKLLDTIDDVKSTLVLSVELMRLHLVRLNETRPTQSARPILQYVALLDIGGMSLNSMVREKSSFSCAHISQTQKNGTKAITRSAAKRRDVQLARP